jgi:hypothetical protein
MIESEGRVREQQACIWATNNNRPWWRSWLVPSLRFAPLPLPFLRISFSNSICWPITAAGCLGGTCAGAVGCSLPLLENRLCSECRRFAFPHGSGVFICNAGIFSTRPGQVSQRSCPAYRALGVYNLLHNQSRWHSGYRPTQVPVMHAEMRVAIW